jgi:hypothetical protein
LIGALGNENVVVEQIPRKARGLSRPHAPAPVSAPAVVHTAAPSKLELKAAERSIAADEHRG